MLVITHLIKIADATDELAGALMSVEGCPEKGILRGERRWERISLLGPDAKCISSTA